tara:strand:- start:2418 stop:2672 length:255 start_codon:yes stop_codon:yes gene_type:complete
MCIGGGGPSTPPPTPLPPPPPAPEPPAPVLPTPEPVVKPVNPAVRKKISKKATGRTGSGSLRIPLDPGAGMGGVGGGPSGGVNT